MRNLLLILTFSLFAGTQCPASAWGLDLFCVRSQSPPHEETHRPVAQNPDLRALLISSPRSSRKPVSMFAVAPSFAIKLDARTRFGISSYSSENDQDESNEASSWPALALGLHCLLD